MFRCRFWASASSARDRANKRIKIQFPPFMLGGRAMDLDTGSPIAFSPCRQPRRVRVQLEDILRTFGHIDF